MRRFLGAILLAAAAPLILAVPASASASPDVAHAAKVHHAGSCRAQGDFAICVAGGTAYNPTTIHVHVSASPNQKVLVSWDLVCAKGFGAGSRSGQFHARTLVNRKISHPYAHPDNCTVSAGAQLSHGGHLHVWITYWR
jgi:hypothetical protein